MNKHVFTLLVAGSLAAGAWAQPNPPGATVPPHTPGVATDKAQQAGERRKNMRPQSGTRKQAGGDTLNTPEGGAIGTDRAAVAGEARAETRDTRRPNKRRSQQGGTPK